MRTRARGGVQPRGWHVVTQKRTDIEKREQREAGGAPCPPATLAYMRERAVGSFGSRRISCATWNMGVMPLPPAIMPAAAARRVVPCGRATQRARRRRGRHPTAGTAGAHVAGQLHSAAPRSQEARRREHTTSAQDVCKQHLYQHPPHTTTTTTATPQPTNRLLVAPLVAEAALGALKQQHATHIHAGLGTQPGGGGAGVLQLQPRSARHAGEQGAAPERARG